MGQRILLSLGILFFLVSCEKSYTHDIINESPPADAQFIRCKIDGVSKTFNFLVKATKQNAGGQNVISVFGKADSSLDNIERINMGISSLLEIHRGTYVENDPFYTYVIDAVYNPDQTDEVWSVPYTPRQTSPFTIAITNITENYVEGTFKGIIYNNSGTGTSKKTITEGEFIAPF
jgi:hypothetical protein